MKWIGIALVACGLVGCTTADTQHVLTNLEGCTRHYEGFINAGALNPGAITGSLKIDCAPKAAPPTP